MASKTATLREWLEENSGAQVMNAEWETMSGRMWLAELESFGDTDLLDMLYEERDGVAALLAEGVPVLEADAQVMFAILSSGIGADHDARKRLLKRADEMLPVWNV